MKSSRPLCLAAALAALLLASAGPVRADDGIHRLWEGFSTLGNPLFQMVESFWSYLAGTDAPDGDRTAVANEGTTTGSETTTTVMPPPPGGGCVDPSGNPITCPTTPK